MPACLDLWLVESSKLALVRSRFVCPKGSEAITDASKVDRQVQWTHAVMAYTWAFISWAAESRLNKRGKEIELLSADKVSPGHSVMLNLAVTASSWRKLFFGVTFKMNTLLRTKTSEGIKRIQLKEETLPPTAIHVFVNDLEITDYRALVDIASKIADQWHAATHSDKPDKKHRALPATEVRSLLRLVSASTEVPGETLSEPIGIAVGLACRAQVLRHLILALELLDASMQKLPKEVVKEPVNYPRMERQCMEDLAAFSGASRSAIRLAMYWPELLKTCRRLDEQSNTLTREVLDVFHSLNNSSGISKERAQKRFQQVIMGEEENTGIVEKLAQINGELVRLLEETRAIFTSRYSRKKR